MIWYFTFMLAATVGLFLIIFLGEERFGCFIFGAAAGGYLYKVLEDAGRIKDKPRS